MISLNLKLHKNRNLIRDFFTIVIFKSETTGTLGYNKKNNKLITRPPELAKKAVGRVGSLAGIKPPVRLLVYPDGNLEFRKGLAKTCVIDFEKNGYQLDENLGQDVDQMDFVLNNSVLYNVSRGAGKRDSVFVSKISDGGQKVSSRFVDIINMLISNLHEPVDERRLKKPKSGMYKQPHLITFAMKRGLGNDGQMCVCASAVYRCAETSAIKQFLGIQNDLSEILST